MLPIRDRALTAVEIERMRLLLSTFRDGSGQRVRTAGFMPDFLSFERACAYVIHGTTNENKGVFDVSVSGGPGRLPWGISCKMAAIPPAKNHCWFMELSNSAKKLNDAVTAAEIVSWNHSPMQAGAAVVATVGSWHEAVRGGYDLDASKYLLLTHDSTWRFFEIACFNLNVLLRVHPGLIHWAVEGRDGPTSLGGYIDTPRGPHRLWQWYPSSGGQLKFFPLIGWEEWRSGYFELSRPPLMDLKSRVDQYWPGAWPHYD
jgi:hypothetical protein